MFELKELHKVLDYEFLRMPKETGCENKDQNLLIGQVIERNFHQNEAISEIDVEKKNITFLYSNRRILVL